MWQYLTSTLSYTDWNLIIKLITGLAPVIVAGFAFYKWYSNRDYKNDYYKKLIDRRLDAYQSLETLLAGLRNTVLDDKDPSKPYHFILSYKAALDNFTLLAIDVTSKSLWLSEEISDQMMLLNKIMYPLRNNIDDQLLINIAKEKYHEIANWREETEIIIADDLLSLHEIEAFLNNNKTKDRKPVPFKIK